MHGQVDKSRKKLVFLEYFSVLLAYNAEFFNNFWQAILW